MPSKRKQSKRKSSEDEEGDPEYRIKRERNNQAVKRSRVKSKQKAIETKGRVDKLEQVNDQLETKISQKRKEIQILKELFLETASRKPFTHAQKVNLAELLADDDGTSSSK